MSQDELAAALARLESALVRRPALGLHDDSLATAVWHGGAHVVARHANGYRTETDLPAELGGSGAHVTPGWLFRAGAAACLATSIAMLAARRGIRLDSLSVDATSRSDARGMLGLRDANEVAVDPGPIALELHVRIAAASQDAATLRALVDESVACSPIPAAVRHATPLVLHVRID